MIAVQGPLAVGLADKLWADQSSASLRPSGVPYFHGLVSELGGARVLVTRTGYTGEDGVEIIVGRDQAVSVWQKLMSLGAQHNVAAAGLGARDTLRLEAAMPLYGQELSESITPYQANLSFCCQFEGPRFPRKIGLGGCQEK